MKSLAVLYKRIPAEDFPLMVQFVRGEAAVVGMIALDDCSMIWMAQTDWIVIRFKDILDVLLENL